MHNDRKLQIMRLAAASAVGIYLYQVYKKEGSFNGAMPGQGKLMINTDRIVDTVMPWLNLNPAQKQMLGEMAKETLKSYMHEKNIQTVNTKEEDNEI